MPAARRSRFPRKLKFLIRQRPRQMFAGAMLLGFSAVLVLALVPGQQRFEARVVATAVSFETQMQRGEASRRFLDNIRPIQYINLLGQQPDTIRLSGVITSSQAEFEPTAKIEIELPLPTSQIQIEPLDTDSSSSEKLELQALFLSDRTMVDALQYIPATQRLGFEFQHQRTPPDLPFSRVELYLGRQPLQVTLSGYRITVNGQTLENTSGNPPLTLTLVADFTELSLSLPQRGELSIGLPPITERDTKDWFWGNLPVTDVDFVREYQSQGDALERSTIQSGQVQMGDKSLDIAVDQFLLLKSPGINNLRYLELIDGEGIEVRVRGRTRLAQVGIDPNFPVQGQRANILSSWLPSDVSVAVVSFAGAMVASILAWLLQWTG